jgi:hypothetical protein
MAQYKVKKGCDLVKICIRNRAYVLCECTEGNLEYLYELGQTKYIDKIEPKKESKKVSKKEESLEDEQGE